MGNQVSTKILALLSHSSVEFDSKLLGVDPNQTSCDASALPSYSRVLDYANMVLGRIKPLLPKRLVKYVMKYMYTDYQDNSNILLLKSLVLGKEPSDYVCSQSEQPGYSSYAEFLHETKKVYCTFITLFWNSAYRKTTKKPRSRANEGDVFQTQVLDKLKKSAAEDSQSGEHTMLLELFEVILLNLQTGATTGFSRSLNITINLVCRSVEKYLDSQALKKDTKNQANNLLIISVQRQINQFVKLMVELCKQQVEQEMKEATIKQVLRLNHKRSDLRGHLELVDMVLKHPDTKTINLEGVQLPEIQKLSINPVIKLASKTASIKVSQQLEHHPISQMTLPQLKIYTAGEMGVLLYGDFVFLCTFDSDTNVVTVNSEITRIVEQDAYDIDLKIYTAGIHQKQLELYGYEPYPKHTKSNQMKKVVVNKINLSTSSFCTFQKLVVHPHLRWTKLVDKSGGFKGQPEDVVFLKERGFLIKQGSSQYTLKHSVVLGGTTQPMTLNFIESTDGTQLVVSLAQFDLYKDTSSSHKKLVSERILKHKDNTLPSKWYECHNHLVPFDSLEAIVLKDLVFVCDRTQNYMVFSLEAAIVLKTGKTPEAIIGFDYLAEVAYLITPNVEDQTCIVVRPLSDFLPKTGELSSTQQKQETKLDSAIMSELGFSMKSVGVADAGSQSKNLWNYILTQTIPLLQSLGPQSGSTLTPAGICHSLTHGTLKSPHPAVLELLASIMTTISNRVSSNTQCQDPIPSALLSSVVALVCHHLAMWRMVSEHSPCLMSQSNSHEIISPSVCAQLVKNVFPLAQIEAMIQTFGDKTVFPLLKMEREILDLVKVFADNPFGRSIVQAYQESGVFSQSHKRLGLYVNKLLQVGDGEAVKNALLTAEMLQQLTEVLRVQSTEPRTDLKLACLEEIMNRLSEIVKPVLSQESKTLNSISNNESVGILADSVLNSQKQNAISIIREMFKLLHDNEMGQEDKLRLLVSLDSNIEFIPPKFKSFITNKLTNGVSIELPPIVENFVFKSFSFGVFCLFEDYFRAYPDMLEKIMTRLRLRLTHNACQTASNYLQSSGIFTLLACEMSRTARSASQSPSQVFKTLKVRTSQSGNVKYRIVKLDPFKKYMIEITPESRECDGYSLVVFRSWYYDTPVAGKHEFEGRLFPHEIVTLRGSDSRSLLIEGAWQIGLMLAATDLEPEKAKLLEHENSIRCSADVKILVVPEPPRMHQISMRLVESYTSQVMIEKSISNRSGTIQGYVLSKKTDRSTSELEQKSAIEELMKSFEPTNGLQKIIWKSVDPEVVTRLLAIVSRIHQNQLVEGDFFELANQILTFLGDQKRKGTSLAPGQPASKESLLTRIDTFEGWNIAPKSEKSTASNTLKQLLAYIENPFELSESSSEEENRYLGPLFERVPNDALSFGLKFLDDHNVLKAFLSAGVAGWRLLAGISGSQKISFGWKQIEAILECLAAQEVANYNLETKISDFVGYFGLIWRSVLAINELQSVFGEENQSKIPEVISNHLDLIKQKVNSLEVEVLKLYSTKFASSNFKWATNTESFPDLNVLIHDLDYSLCFSEIQQVVFNAPLLLGSPLPSHSVSANESLISFKSQESDHYQSDNQNTDSGNEDDQSSEYSSHDNSNENSHQSIEGSGSSSSHSGSSSSNRRNRDRQLSSSSSSDSSSKSHNLAPQVPAPVVTLVEPVIIQDFNAVQPAAPTIQVFGERIPNAANEICNIELLIAPNIETDMIPASSLLAPPPIPSSMVAQQIAGRELTPWCSRTPYPEKNIESAVPNLFDPSPANPDSNNRVPTNNQPLLLLGLYLKLAQHHLSTLQTGTVVDDAHTISKPTQPHSPLSLLTLAPFTHQSFVRLPRFIPLLNQYLQANILQQTQTYIYKYRCDPSLIGDLSSKQIFLCLQTGEIRLETGSLPRTNTPNKQTACNPTLELILQVRKLLSTDLNLSAAEHICATHLETYTQACLKRTPELMLSQIEQLLGYLETNSARYIESQEIIKTDENSAPKEPPKSKFDLLRKKITGQYKVPVRKPADSDSDKRTITPLLEFTHRYLHKPTKTMTSWVAGLDSSAFSPQMYRSILDEVFCRTVEAGLCDNKSYTSNISVFVWKRVALHHLKHVTLSVNDFAHKMVVSSIQNDAKTVEFQLGSCLAAVKHNPSASSQDPATDEFAAIGQIMFGSALIDSSPNYSKQGILFYFDCIFELLHHNLEAQIHKYRALADLFAAFQHLASTWETIDMSSPPPLPSKCILASRVGEFSSLLFALRVVSNDSIIGSTLNLNACVEQLIRASIQKGFISVANFPTTELVARQLFAEQSSMEYALEAIQKDTFPELEDVFVRAALIREVNKDIKREADDDEPFDAPPAITSPQELATRFESPAQKIPGQTEIVLVPWIPFEIELTGYKNWSMNNFDWVKLPTPADFTTKSSKPTADPVSVPSVVEAKKSRKQADDDDSGSASEISSSQDQSDSVDAASGGSSSSGSTDKEPKLRTPHEHLVEIIQGGSEDSPDSVYLLFEERPYSLGQLELSIVPPENLSPPTKVLHKQEVLDAMKNYQHLSTNKLLLQYPARRKNGVVLLSQGGGLDSQGMTLLNRYYSPDNQRNPTDPRIYNQDDDQMRVMVLNGSLYMNSNATHPHYMDVWDYLKSEMLFWSHENSQFHFFAMFDQNVCQRVRVTAKYDKITHSFDSPVASEAVKIVSLSNYNYLVLFANGLAARINLLDKSRSWVSTIFPHLENDFRSVEETELSDKANEIFNKISEDGTAPKQVEMLRDWAVNETIRRFTIWNFKEHHITNIFSSVGLLVLMTEPPEHPDKYILKVYYSQSETSTFELPRRKVKKDLSSQQPFSPSVCIQFEDNSAVVITGKGDTSSKHTSFLILQNIIDFAYWEKDLRNSGNLKLVVIQGESGPDAEEPDLKYLKNMNGKLKEHPLNKVFGFTSDCKLHMADYPFFVGAYPKPQLLFTPEYSKLVEYPALLYLDEDGNLDVTYMPGDPEFYQKFLEAQEVRDGGFSILITRNCKIIEGENASKESELTLKHMEVMEEGFKLYQAWKDFAVDEVTEQILADKILIQEWSEDLLPLDTTVDWKYSPPSQTESGQSDKKPVPTLLFRFKGKVKSMFKHMIAQTSFKTHSRNMACKELTLFPGFQDMVGTEWLAYKESSKHVWTPILNSLSPNQWLQTRDALVELTYGPDTDFNIYIQDVYPKDSQVYVKKNLFSEMLKTMPNLKDKPYLLPAHLELVHCFLVICNDWRYFSESRMIVVNQSVYSGLEKARPNLFGFAFNETRLAPDYNENSDQLDLQVDRYRAEKVTHDNQNLSFLNQLYYQVMHQTVWNDELMTKRNGLQFSFIGEDGYDAGGLFKEYFSHLGTEVTKTLKLFVPSPNFGEPVEESDKLIPNFRLNSQRDLTNFLKFGLAVGTMYRLFGATDIDLPSSLWRFLMKVPLTWKDYKDIDHRLHQLLEAIPNMPSEDVTALGLTFSYDVPCLSVRSQNQEDSYLVDLIAGGRSIKVTAENARLYCELLKSLLLELIRTPYQQISVGFDSAVDGELMRYVSPKILEAAVTGDRKIDVEWLKTAARETENENDENDQPLNPTERAARKGRQNMFWEVLASLSQAELAQYLRFVTGSSRINKTMTTHSVNFDNSKSIIPVAHTCSNTIDVGVYQSADELRRKLLYALDSHKGFLEDGFSGGKRIHDDYDLLMMEQPTTSTQVTNQTPFPSSKGPATEQTVQVELSEKP